MRPKLIFKGPLTTASGYGVHARQVLRGLIAADIFDISVKCISWGNTSFLVRNDPLMDRITELATRYADEQRSGGVKYDVSVQLTIPNEFEKLAKFNVGITAGIEVNVCSPEWIIKSNEIIDLLYVPSRHSKDVFERSIFEDDKGNVLRLLKPIVLAHEGFDPRLYNTEPNERDLFEFDTQFNFLFVGLGINGKQNEERKNITNLIKYFCEAFSGRQDVGLVMKTGMVNNSLMDFEGTKRIIAGIKRAIGVGELPRIHLIHGRLSDEEMANLYKCKSIKAFVSLTCGEGFGLPMLEAAACGLPIIATNWSGHLDFLSIPDVKRSFVELEYELKQVPDSVVWSGVIEKGTAWAYVKDDDVKLKLRKVHASYEKPKEWANALARHVHLNFNEGKVMRELVDDLLRRMQEHRRENPTSPTELVESVRSTLPEGPKLLYTMPMSAGDVYISTAVIDGLRKKFPDHQIYFATNPQYKSILEGNPNIDKVIQFQDWMTNVPICEQVFDEVYTPNLAVQMTFSNWVHKGRGRKLAEEMAVNCNVELGDYLISTVKPKDPLPERYVVFNPGSGKGQWEARNYIHWQDVVRNLERELANEGVKIVQVGLPDDFLYECCVDFRGKTADFKELAYVIQGSSLVLGIDSVTMHLAAGLGVHHVALFGSSYASSTGPVIPLGKKTVQSLLLETPDRYSCDKACYQYSCKVDREHPCINEIDPKNVYIKVLRALEMKKLIDGEQSILVPGLDEMTEGWEGRFETVEPKISGYTHVLNAESGGYPYIESIRSMLGFCDEVIVVDGGSTDGTVERIRSIEDQRIQIIDRKWDWDEPGMDGMQKAYGRAMCTGDFLWQQDVDEVVHEDDYDKVRKLVKRFPKMVDLVHLPVIELWGDGRTVRTDRHSWKWRLSKNNFRITHGINKAARVFDEKTGKTYAKRGMSDGCEYVDIMTGEYILHAGFYTQEIEQVRRTDPKRYGELMNKIFEELPCVFHYSWANIPRKVKNFKQTWDRMWTNLYREQEPEDRFPTVKDENDDENIKVVAETLRKQGGEHGPAQTFKLVRSNPRVMESWLK